MILHEHGKRAVRRRAGLCAQALGDLLLHEHGNAPEAFALDERRKRRRRDVIGKIGADDRRESIQLLTHERGNVGFEDVCVDDLEIAEIRHGFAQDRQKRAIQLDGDDLSRALAQLVAECADAGTDLQNAVFFLRL